jgi:hypothetical protein
MEIARSHFSRYRFVAYRKEKKGIRLQERLYYRKHYYLEDVHPSSSTRLHSAMS